LDEATKTRLRQRAARHGRSMEAEVRDILKSAASAQPRNPQILADANTTPFYMDKNQKSWGRFPYFPTR
jgi:plasmid stability protein